MTVEQLLSNIYEEHWDHIDFIDAMNSGECDCLIHQASNFIFKYAGMEMEEE